ncbi:hypothetical protein AJ79_06290 [Helicocarpus griseus UAMH5409]|uniref:GET complex, subunit GET2 n=1 Tax=Helicocarpus griseus UAMH5409 TaxID=1447875 RepID=A0A2B7XFL1_9EURO|nr:hypothetical protein AJ79_06290 [Helicocarpus griseus UAMH5409]
MSTAEESPAQQAARLRRERREAKIKAGGSARLDKITSLSGRTPSSMRDESPASLSDTTPTPEQPSQPPRKSVSPLPPSPNMEDQTPENIKAQEEYLRALLRSQGPLGQQSPEPNPGAVLSSLLGGSPPSGEGPGNNPFAGGEGGLEFNPVDLASAFGVPSFLANFFLGGNSQATSPAEQRIAWVWKLVHVIFSLAMGVYLLSLFQSSVSTYGNNPPPPATAQNPFVLFMTGEVALSATRVLTRARDGQLKNARAWVQILGEVLRDGKIAVFVLGAGMWLLGGEESGVNKS